MSCLHWSFDNWQIIIFDEDSQPEFRLLQLTDRGGLKYPSEFILESIVTLWKTLIAIESKDNLMAILMQGGSSRKILVEVTLIFLEETDAIAKSSCISCGVSILTILKNVIFTYTNCLPKLTNSFKSGKELWIIRIIHNSTMN